MAALHAGGAHPFPAEHGAPPRRRPLSDPDVDTAFVALVGPDADTLRFPPEDVVNFLAHLTLASAHPMLPVRALTPEEIVSVVLDGTRKAR